MVGLTITHHIPFTEIFLLIKGHLLPWIAEERRLLPSIRAAENGSFKKLESRYHAIIFHALRCLRNDVDSFLVLITKNSPDPCVCVKDRSRFVYLVIYTVQSHSCIRWGGAIMVHCFVCSIPTRDTPIICLLHPLIWQKMQFLPPHVSSLYLCTVQYLPTLLDIFLF